MPLVSRFQLTIASKRSWLIMLLVCLMSIRITFAANMPSRINLTTHNLPPYGSFIKKENIQLIADNNFDGVAISVVRCAAKELNVELTVHVVPWTRAQSLVLHNKADGFFAAWKKDSRDKFAVSSAIIAEQKWT